jgi:hypothetical protein
MSKPDPAAARKVARLERAAKILERFRQELEAFPPSVRRERLLRANQEAVESLQERTKTARTDGARLTH